MYPRILPFLVPLFVITHALRRPSSTQQTTHVSSTKDSIGSLLRTPRSIQEMMVSAADALTEVKKSGIRLSTIDIPLPVTGGTEVVLIILYTLHAFTFTYLYTTAR